MERIPKMRFEGTFNRREDVESLLSISGCKESPNKIVARLYERE